MEGVSGRRSALTFHEEARGNGLGGLRSGCRSVTDRRASRGRRQRHQGCFRIRARGIGRTIPTRFGRITQRFARRETRDPPALLPSTGPEPFGEPSSVLGRERVARLNVARCGHEAQASVREGPPVQIGRLLRREHTRHRDARKWIGSECRRRSERITRPRRPRTRTALPETRDLARTMHAFAVTRGAGKKTSEKVRELRRHRLPTAVLLGFNRTRASQVGFKADSVRVRRLGKSHGLRARASRYEVRVLGAWTRFL